MEELSEILGLTEEETEDLLNEFGLEVDDVWM